MDFSEWVCPKSRSPPPGVTVNSQQPFCPPPLSKTKWLPAAQFTVSDSDADQAPASQSWFPLLRFQESLNPDVDARPTRMTRRTWARVIQPSRWRVESGRTMNPLESNYRLDSWLCETQGGWQILISQFLICHSDIYHLKGARQRSWRRLLAKNELLLSAFIHLICCVSLLRTHTTVWASVCVWTTKGLSQRETSDLQIFS